MLPLGISGCCSQTHCILETHNKFVVLQALCHRHTFPLLHVYISRDLKRKTLLFFTQGFAVSDLWTYLIKLTQESGMFPFWGVWSWVDWGRDSHIWWSFHIACEKAIPVSFSWRRSLQIWSCYYEVHILKYILKTITGYGSAAEPWYFLDLRKKTVWGDT